jgi:hypothetical protein
MIIHLTLSSLFEARFGSQLQLQLLAIFYPQWPHMRHCTIPRGTIHKNCAMIGTPSSGTMPGLAKSRSIIYQAFISQQHLYVPLIRILTRSWLFSYLLILVVTPWVTTTLKLKGLKQ